MTSRRAPPRWLCLLPLVLAATPLWAQEGPARRGAEVFRKYCVLCHGEKADGNGVAAKLHTPRPANLTRSPYSDAYKETIVREGGPAVGRSPAMPPWGKELSEEDIRSVVAYLRVIRVSAR